MKRDLLLSAGTLTGDSFTVSGAPRRRWNRIFAFEDSTVQVLTSDGVTTKADGATNVTLTDTHILKAGDSWLGYFKTINLVAGKIACYRVNQA